MRAVVTALNNVRDSSPRLSALALPERTSSGYITEHDSNGGVPTRRMPENADILLCIFEHGADGKCVTGEKNAVDVY